MRPPSLLCTWWSDTSWSSVAEYTLTGTLTSPNVNAPFQIALIAPVHTGNGRHGYPGRMAGDEQVVRIGGRRVRLTNLDKVLYPQTGTTKGEVIEYYTRIAPLLIPHVTGRPVTRLRWPEGVDEPSFFAKDLERGAPEWVRRMPIPHSSGAKYYPLIDDIPTIVYLAQV